VTAREKYNQDIVVKLRDHASLYSPIDVLKKGADEIESLREELDIFRAAVDLLRGERDAAERTSALWHGLFDRLLKVTEDLEPYAWHIDAKCDDDAGVCSCGFRTFIDALDVLKRGLSTEFTVSGSDD